jgi:hypothetical protein
MGAAAPPNPNGLLPVGRPQRSLGWHGPRRPFVPRFHWQLSPTAPSVPALSPCVCAFQRRRRYANSRWQSASPPRKFVKRSGASAVYRTVDDTRWRSALGPSAGDRPYVRVRRRRPPLCCQALRFADRPSWFSRRSAWTNSFENRPTCVGRSVALNAGPSTRDTSRPPPRRHRRSQPVALGPWRQYALSPDKSKPATALLQNRPIGRP